MPLLCLSMKIGAAPSDATVSTRKRQLCLQGMTTVRGVRGEVTHHFFLPVLVFLRLTFCRCLQRRLLGDRGQLRTLHVLEKTGRACVSPWPGKMKNIHKYTKIDIYTYIHMIPLQLPKDFCAYLFDLLVAEIPSRCFHHSMYICTCRYLNQK